MKNVSVILIIIFSLGFLGYYICHISYNAQHNINKKNKFHACAHDKKTIRSDEPPSSAQPESDDKNLQTQEIQQHKSPSRVKNKPSQTDELALDIFSKIDVALPGDEATTEENLKCLSYEQQDAFLSGLMELLLDQNDKRLFKPIVSLALLLDKIRDKHPKLHKLLADHASDPKPSGFLATFNEFTDNDLPPLFSQANKAFQEKINSMGTLSYGWYCAKIYLKF